jgi:hypothetical protein
MVFPFEKSSLKIKNDATVDSGFNFEINHLRHDVWKEHKLTPLRTTFAALLHNG